MTEAHQAALFGEAPLRAPAARVADGSDLLNDRVRLSKLRATASSRWHFCIQAGLEPSPVSYARVNAALIAAGLAPYGSARRAA
mgnify:CR=1 FL=1